MTTTNDHFHVQRGTSDKMMYPTVISLSDHSGMLPRSHYFTSEAKTTSYLHKEEAVVIQEAAIVIVIVIEHDLHNDLTFSENQKYTSCCACGATKLLSTAKSQIIILTVIPLYYSTP